MKSKAFGFARVSSEDQARGGISLGLQTEAIKKYCEQAGLALAKTWEVAETASFSDEREKFKGMLKEFSADKGVPHLVFYKVDRSNRNSWDHARLEELVNKHDKHLHAALDHFHLHKDATPSEWDRFDMMGLFARSETRHLSARVKSCITQQTKQGHWSYKAPPGYKKLPKAGIEIDSVQGPLVRKLLELAATGSYSLDVLTDEAKRLGILYQGKPLSRSAVYRWVVDPVFAGPFYAKKELVTHFQHTPLIAWKTHERILEKLSDGRRVEKKVRDPQPLAGIFTCGKCSGQISFYRVKGRYSYGFCSSCKRAKKHQPHIEQGEVLVQMEPLVKSFALTPEVGTLLKSWLQDERGNQDETLTAKKAALEQRLSQIKQKLRRAFDALSESVVDSETYRAQTEAWRQEKEKVEIELHALEKGQTLEKWEEVLEAFKLAENSGILWESATPREKAKLAKTVCSNLALNDGTIEFSLAFPFDVLAKSKQNNDWRRG